MSNVKWTFGPEGNRMIFIQDSSGRTLGVVYSAMIGPEEAERWANIFSASSDLLSALKTLTPSECPIITHHSPECGFCFALKAIAMAEGKGVAA